MMILKTWGNSWSTSYRYHEPKLLTCLFGCPDCPDKLAHYVVCPWLFKIVSLIRPDTSSDPLERIALKNTTVESLKAVACICVGYHSIKCIPKHRQQLACCDCRFFCRCLSGTRLRHSFGCHLVCRIIFGTTC